MTHHQHDVLLQLAIIVVLAIMSWQASVALSRTEQPTINVNLVPTTGQPVPPMEASTI